MKYLYKSFALGFVMFSGFAFAAEESVIDVPEKPISEVEFIDTSFVGEEVFIKDDVNESTIYTLGEIKRTLIDDEIIEAKPEIIDGSEFVEIKPDIIDDSEFVEIKPEPPFVEDAESLTPPPILMTLGGVELPENEWVYMTANMSPSTNHHNMSGSGNICVSEPFAIMALLSACVAFMSVRRRKEA